LWQWRAVCCCLVIILLTACTSNGADRSGLNEEQVITIGLHGRLSHLDPAELQPNTAVILNNVKEGLFRIGKRNQVDKALVESYKVSKDERVYTFQLKKDTKWDDGKPVTAADFEFAWKRALTPNLTSSSVSLFYVIKNAQRYHLGKTTQDQVGVKATGKYTLVVTLERPENDFIERLASPAFAPVRKDVVEKFGEAYGTKAESIRFNGPFVVKEWTPAKVVLQKNPNYWDQENVTLERAEFSLINNANKEMELYENEQLCLIPLYDHTDEYQHSKEFVESPEAKTSFITFNMEKKYLDNSDIRKAISYAIDRDVLTKQALRNFSKSADGLIPPNVEIAGESYRKSADSKLVEFDVEKAKKYLKRGLKEINLSKMPELKIVTTSERVGVEVKRQLQENLGIEVKLVTIFSYDDFSKENGDLEIRDWKATYNDPMSFLEIFYSKSGQNNFHFSNEKYDKLIQKEHELSDSNEKRSVASEAEKLLVKKLVAIVPLYFEGGTYLQKSYVKEVYRHPYVADLTLKWAYVTDQKE
jgi:oligopeptide transport system substrate-binding protein